jgi:hypothetical protein
MGWTKDERMEGSQDCRDRNEEKGEREAIENRRRTMRRTEEKEKGERGEENAPIA